MSDAGPPATRALLHPFTGEVIELAATHEATLAEWRDQLGEYKRLIDATLVEIDAELTNRLDHENRRSAKFEDWEIETEAPLAVSWDVHMLGLELEALVQAKRLTRPAAAAALEAQPIEYKARARELKKLLEHADPEVREAIARCRSTNPRRRRRVTVKRTAPAERRLRGAQGPQEGAQ